MAKEGIKEVPKKKTKTEEKTSVKSYQQGIDVEKQEMTGYSKKFGTTVRSLQADFKRHQKEIKEAAVNMREEGAEEMSNKINKFKGEIRVATKAMDNKVDKFNADIKNQIKENKEAVSRIGGSAKFLVSEINKKEKDFRSYAKAFLG